LHLRRAYALIFVCFLLETSWAGFLPFSLPFPHISFIVLIFVSVSLGAFSGLQLGLFLGFLLDAVSLDPFGTYMITYALLGSACGFLRGKVFAESFVSQWMIPAGAYLLLLIAMLFMAGAIESVSQTPILILRLIKSSPFIPTVIIAPFVFILSERLLRNQKAMPKRRFF